MRGCRHLRCGWDDKLGLEEGKIARGLAGSLAMITEASGWTSDVEGRPEEGELVGGSVESDRSEIWAEGEEAWMEARFGRCGNRQLGRVNMGLGEHKEV